MENSGKSKKRIYNDRRTGKYSERLVYNRALKDKAVELVRKLDKTYRWADLFEELLKNFPENEALQQGRLTSRTVLGWKIFRDTARNSASKHDAQPAEIKSQNISEEDLKILRREHLQRLKQYVDVIRKCLEHPTLNYLPDRGLLTFRGYDWRLDPDTWFHLSTPDFDSEDWGIEHTMFKSHASASPFWDHYEQLKRGIERIRR